MHVLLVLITKVTSLQESVESQYNPSPSGRLDTASRLIFSGAHSLSIMIDWQLCQNKRKMNLQLWGCFVLTVERVHQRLFPGRKGRDVVTKVPNYSRAIRCQKQEKGLRE